MSCREEESIIDLGTAWREKRSTCIRIHEKMAKSCYHTAEGKEKPEKRKRHGMLRARTLARSRITRIKKKGFLSFASST